MQAASGRPAAFGAVLAGRTITACVMSAGPRITDPHSVPVVGVDDHLPAIPADWLTAPALRAHPRLHWAEWSPALTGDGRLAGFDRGPAAAAVLIPLVGRESGLQVLLTRRTEHLKAHAGQISFPGGRAEPTDDGAVDTALREAEEEIGLVRRHVEVLGTMPVYTTVTGFEVTPVVALVHPPVDLRLDPFEVAEAFEVPLSCLMNPAHHRRHLFETEAGSRQFLSMPWRAHSPGGIAREFFIWGATAAMLRNLYEFLGRRSGYHRR